MHSETHINLRLHRPIYMSTLTKSRNFKNSRYRTYKPEFSSSRFVADRQTDRQAGGQNQEHQSALRSRVQTFPAWHTKAAPNGKCCEGYIGYIYIYIITSSQMWKACLNKGRLCWKIAKLFYFCHLKKLVRPETFGPYYVCLTAKYH